MRSPICAIVLAGLLLAGVALSSTARTVPGAPQERQALPSPSAVVKPHAYVSLEPVPRGREFQAAIVVEIARGFHVNSHKPSESYLIPTTVTPELPAGIELLDTIYPAGTLEKFAFSPAKPLDVYTGSVTLRLRLTAAKNAPLGAATIPVTLRYQACNDTTCLQPVKVPVEIKLQVANAGAKARAVHPEVFTAENSSQKK